MIIIVLIRSWANSIISLVLNSVHNDSIFYRLLVNSGWMVGSQAIAAGIGLIQGILITRLLGVEQYGILSIITTFVIITKHFISFRMNEFIVKYLSNAMADNRNDVASATIRLGLLFESLGSLIAFALTYIIAPFISRRFIGNTVAIEYIYIYAGILLIGLVNETCQGVLQFFKKFRQLSFITVLYNLFTFLAILVVFIKHSGIVGVLISYFIGQSVLSICLIWSMLRLIKKEIHQKWWKFPSICLKGHRGKMLKFAVYTNISTTLSLITKESDSLWLGYFRNPTEVGYYKLASTLASIVMMPVAPFARTFYPELAQSISMGCIAEIRRTLKKATIFSGVWFVITLVGSFILGPFLIGHLFGVVFLPAIPAFLILLVGSGIAQIFFWVRPGLLSLGRADMPMTINIFIAVSKIALSFIVIPRWGYIGNALTLTLLFIFGVGFGSFKFITMLHKLESEKRNEYKRH